MPRSLVAFAGADGGEDGYNTGHEIGRTGQDKRYGVVEAQSFNYCRKERIETIRGEVQRLHEDQEV